MVVSDENISGIASEREVSYPAVGYRHRRACPRPHALRTDYAEALVGHGSDEGLTAHRAELSGKESFCGIS